MFLFLKWLPCPLLSTIFKNRVLTSVVCVLSTMLVFVFFVTPFVLAQKMLYWFWRNFVRLYLSSHYAHKVCEFNPTFQWSGLHVIFLVAIHMYGVLGSVYTCLHDDDDDDDDYGDNNNNQWRNSSDGCKLPVIQSHGIS